ncbi:hypothetical protein LA080_000166 [Diaporthe eres]|nr:hypothetical protein LA080_000166 [Diaporthe eres]
MAKRNKQWYAVIKGRKPGIYCTWEGCKAQVHKYSGCEFFGFFSREEAVDWMETVNRRLSSRTTSRAKPTSGASVLYAVARGRQPGIYRTLRECREQVCDFPDARFKKFEALADAIVFVAVYGGGGHFSQFTSQGFEPDDTASFGEEWVRLSQSQGWTPGTKQYSEQRASALRNELRTHYFASPCDALPIIKRRENDQGAILRYIYESQIQQHERAVELHGFQSMCRAVGRSPGTTVEECQRILRRTLVNIVDMIDARRTGSEGLVPTRMTFEAFEIYTMDPAGADKTIPEEVAEEDPLLRCFQHNLLRTQDWPGQYWPGATMSGGGAAIKKRSRSEEDNDSKDCEHQKKRIMCR